jgi:hypothetical protein
MILVIGYRALCEIQLINLQKTRIQIHTQHTKFTSFNNKLSKIAVKESSLRYAANNQNLSN